MWRGLLIVSVLLTVIKLFFFSKQPDVNLRMVAAPPGVARAVQRVRHYCCAFVAAELLPTTSARTWSLACPRPDSKRT